MITLWYYAVSKLFLFYFKHFPNFMIFVHAFASAITTNYVLKYFDNIHSKSNIKNLTFSKFIFGTTKLTSLNKVLSTFQMNLIWFFGIVSGVLPDFDLLYVLFNPQVEHRKLITHSLVPYLVTFLLIYIILKKFKNNIFIDIYKFLQILNIVIFIGILSHLVLDFFVGGLVLFLPFTNYYFGYYISSNLNDPLHKFNYFTSKYIIAEFVVYFFYVYILNQSKFIIPKFLPYIFFIISVISTIFFF